MEVCMGLMFTDSVYAEPCKWEGRHCAKRVNCLHQLIYMSSWINIVRGEGAVCMEVCMGLMFTDSVYTEPCKWEVRHYAKRVNGLHQLINMI